MSLRLLNIQSKCAVNLLAVVTTTCTSALELFNEAWKDVAKMREGKAVQLMMFVQL